MMRSTRPTISPRWRRLRSSARRWRALTRSIRGYQALKAKLAEAYGQKPDAPVVRIPSGPVLKLGKDKRGKEIVMSDARVPLLRERLGLPASPDNTAYDKPLADAVARFQKQRELSANGQLNAATLAALNGQRRDRDADIIIANMERWRWLPRELGKTHVIVNIPDYTLRVDAGRRAGLEDQYRRRQAGRLGRPRS